MRHNKSLVCTGIPKLNWKCNTPFKTNPFGDRPSRDTILHIQPIKSSLLLGSCCSSQLCCVPCIARPRASIWVTELSSTYLLASPSTAPLHSTNTSDCWWWCCAVLSSLGLAFRSLEQCCEASEWAHGAKSHRVLPQQLPCVLQRWLSPDLCYEGRGFTLSAIQWAEAGIKPVQ